MTQSVTESPLTQLRGDWEIDPAHSRIGFVARHAMVTKVRGSFNEFEGHAHLDGDDPGKSTATLTIKAASIDTRNAQRDAHLRSNDFLDMDNHPDITFRSTAAEKVDDVTYRLSGDLSIRGVTKPVTVDFEFTGVAKDPFGNTRAGFEGSTTINRKDWGVNWNTALEAGGVLVSDRVTLEFEIAAVKSPTS
jgi:polyisoprenoid-binding protein YceI